MRVMLVGPYPLDDSRFDGGVQTSFYNLVDGMRQLADLEPHVVTFVRGGTARRDRTQGGVPVTYLPAQKRFNNLTFYRSDRRLMRDAYRSIRPDIVHAQDAIGYGYVAVKEVRDVPVVVSIHGVVEQELRNYTRRIDRVRTRVARIAVQRYTIGHARHLLQPSPYPQRHFGASISGEVATVENAVAERFFATVGERQPGRLLYVGGVSPGKRVIDLVDVLARVRRGMPHAHLRIAGPLVETEYVNAVLERAAGYGLRDAVVVLGALAPDQLADEYASAQVFMLASGQENSPMVICEAMAARVPVVATRVGGVDTLVDDGVTGYLADVGDVAALARHSLRLLGDEETRVELGEAARAVADARFRPIVVAGRVRDEYQRIVQGAPWRDHVHAQVHGGTR